MLQSVPVNLQIRIGHRRISTRFRQLLQLLHQVTADFQLPSIIVPPLTITPALQTDPRVETPLHALLGRLSLLVQDLIHQSHVTAEEQVHQPAIQGITCRRKRGLTVRVDRAMIRPEREQCRDQLSTVVAHGDMQRRPLVTLMSNIDRDPGDQKGLHNGHVLGWTEPHRHIQPRQPHPVQARGIVHRLQASATKQHPQDHHIDILRRFRGPCIPVDGVDRQVDRVVAVAVVRDVDACAVVEQRADHGFVAVRDRVVQRRPASAVTAGAAVAVHRVQVYAETDEMRNEGFGARGRG